MATLLALFFGIFGIHRFYLDQRNIGIAHIAMFFLGAFIFTRMDWLVAVPAMLGVVDFLVFLSTSRQSFDERYNQEYLQQKQHQQELAFAKANDPRNILNEKRSQYLEQARTAYQNYEYQPAIDALQKAIEIKYDDPETHFFLARVYSVSEQPQPALEHLNIAVAFGLEDTNRIRTEDDLAFLRIQPAYRTFESNNFQLNQERAISKADSLDLKETQSPDLLDQLSRLEQQKRKDTTTDKPIEKQLNPRDKEE